MHLARQHYPACVLIKCTVYLRTSKASKLEMHLARQLYPAQAWHDEHCRQVLCVSICTFVLAKRASEEPKQSLNRALNEALRPGTLRQYLYFCTRKESLRRA